MGQAETVSVQRVACSIMSTWSANAEEGICPNAFWFSYWNDMLALAHRH